MENSTERVSRLISRLVKNKLTVEEKKDLESWKQAAIQNKLLAESFTDESVRAQRIADYKLANSNELWSNFRVRAARESGYHLEEKPELPMPSSPMRNAIMILTILLGLLCLTAIIFMTVSNIRNHRFPVKSIQQRGFRF